MTGTVDFTPSQPPQKKPWRLGIRLTSLVKGSLSCLTNTLPDWQGHGDLKDLDWGTCKYLLPSWWKGCSSFFCRGNCVCIVTVVCEEMQWFASTAPHVYLLYVNVPALLPHVPNTVQNALFLNKLVIVHWRTAGCFCLIRKTPHAHTNTLHPVKRWSAASFSSFSVFWRILLGDLWDSRKDGLDCLQRWTNSKN